MIFTSQNTTVKNTSYKIVIPFYIYAAISFFVGCSLLLFSSSSFLGHYFQPHLLAITHCMALGWGTMIILGACHQLVPVLIESKLYSDFLANASFVFSAVGIPILIYSFYIFDMGLPAQIGAWFIVISIFLFLINIAMSMVQSKNESIHALFVITATVWLLFTILLGVAQVYNFTMNILPNESLYYLSLHAHTGIVGWFLLLVIGVSSRLIPMFLISKYSNTNLLKIIYTLINFALILFLFLFLFSKNKSFFFLPILLVFVAIAMFVFYCYKAYKSRIRKQVDEQMKLSLVSVSLLLLPVLLLLSIVIILIFTASEKLNIILSYGFLIFFGWITAIILGMTFKTLPFIIWNKVYHLKSGIGKTPNPKDLFNNLVFKIMFGIYILGILIFTFGILLNIIIALNIGAFLLFITSILYIWNVLKIFFHKPIIS